MHYLTVFGKHEKIIQLLDDHKPKWGDYKEHTLVASTEGEIGLAYVLTRKDEVAGAVKDLFRHVEINAKEFQKLFNTFQQGHPSLKLYGMKSLVPEV